MSEQRFPWRTLLFVSAAINLLVIGGIAGALASGARIERDDPEAIVARMPAPRAFMAALPPETRVKIRAELVNSWVETREARVEARNARRDAFAAAGAEPFDAAAVKAAFARMRTADQAAIGVFHDNM
ncbi:MAG TPA: periplasmic heavy metal sensor, partial [Verrucomicrobiae bacterium]|nr:periplasmic heavy metal sensor [Verrucomicrobiae bacterium]